MLKYCSSNRNLSNQVVLEGGVDPNADHPTRDEPDLFGLELKYDHHTALDATNPGTPQYNGNIAAALWQTRQGGTPRGLHAYQYCYDAADRLTSANFRSYTFTPTGNGFGTWGWGNAAYDYSLPELAYDRNGNLRRLSRKGPQPDSLLDKLTFAYRGNRMIAANDEVVGSAPTNDFEDNGVRLPVEYRYDASGNLTADANKGLDSIAYNHLNLPEFLHWQNGNTLRYVYSATGRKLLAYADGHDQPDGPPVHRLTAYVGPSGFQYATDANDSLRLLHLPTPEGRLVFLPDRADKNAGFVWQYEYHLKDQVGNLRLAFRTRGRTARDIEDSFEPDQRRSASANQQPQVEHKAETRYRAPLLARTGEHVALVNAREAQHRVGPSLTVPVQAGDSVYASVYARIEPPLPRPWWKMALPSPEMAELDAAKNSRRLRFWPRLGLNLAPWLLPQAHRTTTTGQVYMRVQTLNEQQQVLSEERFYVDPAVSPTQWQYLLAKLAAAQSGYVRVELVNESGDNAYFDDLQVRLVNDLIQENHYDPFGLNLAELEVKGDPDCKYQFNGKEKQEGFGLGWNDHGWRNYAPDGSRWFSIDPLAAEFPDESPYVFGHNNLVRFFDPNGCVSIDGQLEITEADTRSRASARDDAGNDDITVYGVGTNGKKAPLAIVKTDLANTSVTTKFKSSGAQPTVIDLTNKNLGKLTPDAFMISLGFDATYGVGLGSSWQIVIINKGIQAGQVFFYGPEHLVNDINIGYNLGAGIMAGPVDFNEKSGTDLTKDTFNGLSQGWSGGVGFYSQARITGYADGYRHAPFFSDAVETYNANLYGAGMSKAQYGFQYTYSYAYRFEPFWSKKQQK